MGVGKLSVSRTDQGPGFADRTRALAAALGATFEPWDTARVRAIHDVVRDVAVAGDVGVLRIARGRSHLEDLFAGEAS